MDIVKITDDNELQKAFAIRQRVFVEEQNVPAEDEFDEFDTISEKCEHIVLYKDSQPVGTGRIRWVDEYGKLERICILKSFRKLGIGKVIIATLENIAQKRGFSHVKLHGQTQAEGFYVKLGYETASPIFMEDGIPHILMTKKL